MIQEVNDGCLILSVNETANWTQLFFVCPCLTAVKFQGLRFIKSVCICSALFLFSFFFLDLISTHIRIM
jgi:hypothetical protein